MSKAVEVGVVVVTYHSADTINECLERLLAATHVARIVVVDNASADSTAEKVAWLSMRDGRVRVVRNTHNRGFAEACNQGASALGTTWVAFVNPDAYVDVDTFDKLLTHARAHAGAGLLGVDLHDEDGVFDPAARRRDLSLLELYRQRGQRDDLYLGRDPAVDLQVVEAISGALMLMPSGLFVQLGGFDDGYLLHVEDLDLCRRVRAAGYDVLIANDVSVTHVRGVSSRARPYWVEWQKHRSAWRYFLKFEDAQTPPNIRPLLWLGLWAHCFVAMARIAIKRLLQR
ncbi:MAG TPA: glycosyltransferase family 2 protein [Arenimonas sp.]|uniref:glycosyltransferase family 2 protein n=1 Tax=Arenimonas sp. TaxID=1872635 RepID=UPI002CC5756A|nr:glycosyltransferase family 2 protein [Arenimonas sp.]HMB57859.1 glycosyltransferase family 2 protein [Arenimonas sp.]